MDNGPQNRLVRCIADRYRQRAAETDARFDNIALYDDAPLESAGEEAVR